LRWGKREIRFGLRLDAWTAWWLFSGLAAFSYTFFIDWESVPAAIKIQFWPLYILLALSMAAGLLRKARISLRRSPGLMRSSHITGGFEG